MSRFFSNRNVSILLLVFASISILVLLGRGIYLLVDGLIAYFQSISSPTFLGTAVLDACSMLLCASLLIPLMIGCIRHLQGRDLPTVSLPPANLRLLLLLSLIWVVLVAASSLLVGLLDFGWIFAAPGFLLGILFPVAAFAWIGAGGLFTGTRRRLWAAFGLGMTGGSALAIILEYALVAVAIAIGAVLVAIRPELMETLQTIQSQLLTAGNMEEILTVLAPYLTQPWIFIAVLVFIAGLGPLIEEAVKPLAVWLLGRRLRSPLEGFALGALSGAGFALIEGLMSASGMVEVLYFGLPARLASSLMHITLSALVGWGIASAFLEKRWKRLIGIYLLSSLLHGLWNGSALLAVYGALRVQVAGLLEFDFVSILFVLVGMVLLCLVFVLIATALPVINRKLRAGQNDIIAPLISRTERIPDGLDNQGS